MTKQQADFIIAYFECLNGAKAARRAGYSVKTARQMAYKLKKLPAFQKAMDIFNKELDRRRQQIIAQRFT
jgi:phage terminase small subunit